MLRTGFLPLHKLYSLLKLRFNFCVSVEEHKSRSLIEIQTAVLGTSSTPIIHGEKLLSQSCNRAATELRRKSFPLSVGA